VTVDDAIAILMARGPQRDVAQRTDPVDLHQKPFPVVRKKDKDKMNVFNIVPKVKRIEMATGSKLKIEMGGIFRHSRASTQER
jgi:hypothetical protein